MKTTDLIPILLYHLKDGDKYGLELINACSECSNGQISVKQPTLYSVLKKLEKSKFISSYWQDSDIGGKRHYFKITDNGLSQLETYPPLEDLVKMAVTEDSADISETKEEINEEEQPKKVHSPSPFDNFSVKKIGNTTENSTNVFDKLFVKYEEIKEVVEQQIIEENSEINTLVEEFTQEANNNESAEKSEDINSPISQDNITNINEINTKNKDFSDTLEEKISEQDKLNKTKDENVNIETKTSSFNVFDALDFGNSDENSEILTSPNKNFELENPFFKEVQEKSLEEKSNLEINEENSKLFSKDEKTDNFVTNKKVSKFTEKNIAPTETIKKEISDLFNKEVKPITPTTYETEESIRYQDYIDIKNDKNVKKIVKTANLRLYKVLTSSMFSFIAILACFFVVLRSGFSPIFTVFSIISALYVVYYACNFIGKFKEHRFVIGENFSYNFKKKFLFRISLFAGLILFVLIYNLVKKYSLLAFSNFANFLAPVIISTLLLVDYIFALIFYKKL